MSKHGTSWEDAWMAEVISCNDKQLGDAAFVLNTHDDGICPECGETVRLWWDVRVVAAPQANHAAQREEVRRMVLEEVRDVFRGKYDWELDQWLRTQLEVK